jgi:hypothetical protein
LPPQNYCLSSDGVRYLRATEDFYTGEFMAGLSSHYPPGYPVLIAAIYALFGDWELAGQNRRSYSAYGLPCSAAIFPVRARSWPSIGFMFAVRVRT